MTKTVLEKELKYLALQAGLNPDGLDAHIDYCVDRGLADFWNAYGWSWRTRPHELSISSEAEQYELPDDFAGVRTARQKASTYGGEVVYIPLEEFHRDYPRPTAHDSGYPIECTAYCDSDDDKWYMKFFPMPEVSTTIYLELYTTLGAVDSVPEGFESGLHVSCEKYLFKNGTIERAQSWKAYDREVKRLQRTDSPFRGHLTRILQPPTPAVEEGFRAWFPSS
jgi:hypothetical protein